MSERGEEREGQVLAPGRGAGFRVRLEDGTERLVDGVVPGERVTVRLREGDPERADLVTLMEAAPERREPPCPHFGRCGGCHWLHVGEAVQQRWRRMRLLEALAEEGVGLDGAKLTDTPPSPGLGGRYRARFQCSVREGRLRLGYHRLRGREIEEVEDCPLLAPPLARAYAALRAELTARPILDLTGVELATAEGLGGALAFLNPRDKPPEPWPAVGERLLASTGGALLGAAVQLANTDPRPRRLGAKHACGHTPGGMPVMVVAGGFLQSHLAGADTLAATVVRLARIAGGERVLELYAGAGLLGRALAEAGAHVRGIESAPDAAFAARELPPPAAGSLTIERGDALRVDDGTLSGAELVIADPPRAGLGPLAARLAACGPARLVLVTCSVATLAKDLAMLTKGGYSVREIVPLDLFPGSRHLETVVSLTR